MIEGKKIVGPAYAPASQPPRPPVWAWPHLLSLDAPAVAVIWQAWWARVQGAPLHWQHHAVLGLSVWMIYLADRLADGFHAPATEWGTLRHAFYVRWRLPLVALLGAVVGALIILTPQVLTGQEFAGGAALLALAAAYFWFIHGHRQWTLRAPKEAAVGVLFAAGVTFFVLCQAGPSRALVVRAILFAVLCFLNCALITRWECSLRDRRQRTSLLNAFPRLTERLGPCAGVLGAIAAAAGIAFGRPWSFTPLVLGAASLWALDLARDRVPAAALRVLADVALLTPFLFLQLT